MKTVIILSFINIRNTFSGFLSTKKRGKKSGKGLIILFGFLGVYIAALLGFTTFFMYDKLKEFDLQNLIPIIFSVAASLLIFVTSIFYTPGFLYKSKDYQMLSALPISQRQIFLSKFFMLYVYDMIFSVMILGVSGGVYLYLEKADLLTIILIVISVFIMPLIPLFLSTLISYFTGYAFSKFKKKNIITTIFILVFITIILYFSQNTLDLTDMLVKSGGKISDYILRFYPPAGWFGKLLGGEWISFVFLTLISIIPIAAMIWVTPKIYPKLCAIYNQSNVKNDYIYKSQKSSSKMLSLFKKEISHLFAVPTYLFNSMASLIICISFLFSLMAFPQEMFDILIDINTDYHVNFLIITFALTFASCISSSTASAISIEGNSFWILKSAPVTIKEIFYSKMFLNIVLNLPFILIFDVVFTVLLKASVIEALAALVLPVLSMLCITVYGLIINIYKPKLDWKNVTQAIKNSASAMILTFSSMGFSMLVIGGSIALIATKTMPVIAVIVMDIAILTVMLYVFMKILFSKGVERFNSIY